jgi:hypothetical protein
MGDYSLRSWWQGGRVMGSGSNFLNFLNFRGIRNGRKFGSPAGAWEQSDNPITLAASPVMSSFHLAC